MPYDETLAAVQLLNDQLSKPFWGKWDFWIPTSIGLLGVALTFLAYREAGKAKQEAGKAKQAAVDAGRNVKVQTVAIELSEVSQRIDSIEPSISYSRARDLLAEISRKLRRVTSPFADDQSLSTAIAALRDALDSAQQSLKSVRPSSEQSLEVAPQSVYYGIEYDFSNINNLIADLIGLLEKGTIGLEHGNDDA